MKLFALAARMIVALTAAAALIAPASAQIHLLSDAVRKERLAELADLEEQIMVEMRDGVRLSTQVYLPKDRDGPVPAIFWRSPYTYSKLKPVNPNYSDANLKFALDAVEHGYAFVMQNERGKFFSEGDWEILGRPRTDGYDALSWIADQPWSNGKVGTIGCSSTAEWQMALAATNHPAHAASVPMGAGAGIGRVGPYYEQGNFYKGGVVQLPMVNWLYSNQLLQRPQFSADLTREERTRVARYFELKPAIPADGVTDNIRHLPVSDMIVAAGGPPGVFEEMAMRDGPDDPAWYEGGLYHDDESFGTPALWVNSWYDLSVAPNIALFNHAREKGASRAVRDNQYMIVGPTEHCHMYRMRDPHVVGDRNMGTIDVGLDEKVWAFLDRFVKGERNGFERRQPKVEYFAMGGNEWKEAEAFPPQGAETMTLYMQSADGANSVFGDGALADEVAEDGRDTFTYDPMNPVPTNGANACCLGDMVKPGSFDQRPVEARQDVLVYTSAPLEEDLEVSGFVGATLFVSSDAPDTDFTVKLVDVAPDGTAWNLDDTIQRVRYREGYDREVMMEPGEIYEVEIAPLATSNIFKAGHRIRVEISSSNFPRYARNLNMGTRNTTESEHQAARNSLHFGPETPSRIELTVVP